MSHVARASASDRLLSASALMAAGTVVSRLSGFVRSALLAATLGFGLNGDAFNIANTIPNTLYILLAGGVFNAVLVPQLVRAINHDADGGEAYTNRIITLSALFLGAVTVLLTLAAPLVADLYLNSKYDDPALAAVRSSAVDFTRWCLPQVFFYGMFVLVGQVLNSRGRFAPMMWAPIANNVVSMGVLVSYLALYGEMSSKRRDAGFTGSQETLLGLGSTLGIVLQFLILLPYLSAAGFRFRPRFDFRHTGLGRTLGLGTWTVAFVIVNQIAFAVIVNLSGDGSSQDSGFTLYTTAFLVATVPHSVIAVSLATAALPALSDRANRADLDGLRQLLVGTLRNALAVLAPLCALLPLLASYVAAVMLFGAAGGRDQAHLFSSALALFAPGVLLTSVHYLLLRGLYAVERNKSAFFNQFWVALVNIVAAFVLVGAVPKRQTALALIGAYDLSYVVGVVLSVLTLTRMLRGLEGGRTRRYLVRLALATAGSAAVAWLATRGLAQLVATPAWPTALAFAVLVTGVAGAVYLVLARLMHLREVTQVLRTLTRGRAG